MGLRAFLLLISFVILQTIYADTYAIYFKDKAGSSFTLQNPNGFLSPACIARRERQGIGFFETDLPISDNYSNKVKLFSIHFRYASRWLNCIVIDCESQATIDSISSLSFVSKIICIKKNTTSFFKTKKEFEDLSTTAIEDLPYSLYGRANTQTEMIRVDFLHKRGYQGKGVQIAVFDVGFANANNIDGFKHLFDEGRIIGTYDVVDQETNVYDNKSHGTSCLSCMAAFEEGSFVGTAPKASYGLFRTEDDASESLLEEYNWVFAAEFAESGGAEVFSTSLGYTEFDDPSTNHVYADLDGNTTVITKGSNLAARLGIIVVTSAGNEGSKPWYYISAPADADSIIAIGAVRGDRTVARFSSRGPNSAGKTKPDVCTMGEGPVVYDAGGSIFQSNGTSFSCPIMAGGAACLRQAFPRKSNFEIMDAIRASAHLFKTPNDSFGYGIPDLAVAFVLLSNNENPSTAVVKSELDIYPNPFSSLLQLYIAEPNESSLTATLFDLEGKEMLVRHLEFATNARHFLEINTSDLAQGTYLLKLQGKSFYELKRVVKH